MKLTQEEFDQQYTLISPPSFRNGTGDSDTDWWDTPSDIDTDEFMQAIEERRVWTEIDTEDAPDGSMVFITLSGYHWVNRVRHYVTVEPYPWDELIEVEDRVPRG